MTASLVFDALARIVELADEITRQAREIIEHADPDDRAGLLEGVAAIEVGARRLSFEVALASGDYPMRGHPAE